MSSLEPSTAGHAGRDNDRVVRELDVYVTNGALGSGTQLYLLQSPLRPPWRPYQERGLHKVKLKPKARKLHCEAVLDSGGKNYNSNVEPSRQVKALALQSSRVDLPCQLAGGFVEGDSLILFPIQEVVQLRPAMGHLDKEKEAGGKAGKGGEDGGEGAKAPAAELMPLTVQVKRRETEHQQQARLRSYAYLQQQEEGEPWVELKYNADNSQAAFKTWDLLLGVEEGEVPHTLSREQYLEAIVPGAASLEHPPQEMNFGGNVGLLDLSRPSSYASRREMEEQAAAVAARRGVTLGGGSSWGSGGAAAGSARAGASGAAGPAAVGRREAAEQLPDDVVAALPAVVGAALKFSPVLSLEQIRKYIRNLPQGPAKPAGAASDASLHQALMAGGSLACIRKCYMHRKLGNPTLDPLRDVLLELLAEKESLRRSDIIEAAKVKGIQVSDALYAKVVKELCTSRGSLWSLKTPL